MGDDGDFGAQAIRPPLELEFERFYRVDNAVTRRIGGAGLGLHFCKTYVKAMGGAIRVESEEGQGSVCSFSLPQANS